jgi:Cys-tRNA(Pro)/Cys-tRNA(Cys) deacylase
MEALDDGVDTYGEAVAVQLGVEPERLFKTLLAEVDDEPVVAVVPVSERLSMKGLARAAGGKRASLMAPVDAERLTGYVTGGISPLGQRRTLPTFVDETIELFDRVCLSAGRRGLQVELSARDLIALLDATVADLT